MLQSARAEIVNYNEQDQLLLTASLNTPLNSFYDNGVLSITGEASLEEYEAAISSIVYNNTDSEPLSDVKRITITVTGPPLYDTMASTTSNSIVV